MQPTKHLLTFEPITRIIEDGFSQLPPWINFHLSVQEYALYLLEWLSVKIEDEHADSASDLAIAYLKRNKVDENFARQMSHYVMDALLYTITGTFPYLTFRELSMARYVLEDEFTLAVYLPLRALCAYEEADHRTDGAGAVPTP